MKIAIYNPPEEMKTGTYKGQPYQRVRKNSNGTTKIQLLKAGVVPTNLKILTPTGFQIVGKSAMVNDGDQIIVPTQDL